MKNNLTLEAKSDRGSRRWDVFATFNGRYATVNGPTLKAAAEEAVKQLGGDAERILREGMEDE